MEYFHGCGIYGKDFILHPRMGTPVFSDKHLDENNNHAVVKIYLRHIIGYL